MRYTKYTLLALLILIQYPLWFGKGGWFKVWEYERLLDLQKVQTQQIEIRNIGMKEEVSDLKNGYAAVEERARFDQGMIKPGEVFIHAAAKASSADEAN